MNEVGYEGNSWHGQWESMGYDQGGMNLGSGEDTHEGCNHDHGHEKGFKTVDKYGKDMQGFQLVERKKKGATGICQFDKSDEEQDKRHGSWEKIRVQFGSGAFDWVIPKDMVSGIPVIETESSKAGVCYVAANGTDIKNYGDKTIQGYSDEGFGISAKMQVAYVKKILGAAVKYEQVGGCGGVG